MGVGGFSETTQLVPSSPRKACVCSSATSVSFTRGAVVLPFRRAWHYQLACRAALAGRHPSAVPGLPVLPPAGHATLSDLLPPRARFRRRAHRSSVGRRPSVRPPPEPSQAGVAPPRRAALLERTVPVTSLRQLGGDFPVTPASVQPPAATPPGRTRTRPGLVLSGTV